MQYKISDFNARQTIPELRTTGVYKITTQDNRLYIGSASQTFRQRWGSHKNDLKRQKHHSQYLQNIFNKYGQDYLSFSIIEIINNKNLILEREQYWIDILKPQLNLQQIAGSSIGYKHSEQTRQKYVKAKREALTGTGVTYRKNRNSYQALIRIPEDRINLGFYKTHEEALKARLQGELLFWSKEFDSKSKEEREIIVAQFRLNYKNKRASHQNRTDD